MIKTKLCIEQTRLIEHKGTKELVLKHHLSFSERQGILRNKLRSKDKSSMQYELLSESIEYWEYIGRLNHGK